MSRKRIGIDIGETSIRLVACSGRRIRRVACEPVPEGLVSGGIIRDADALAKLLRAALRKHRMPHWPAAIVLPNAALTVRNLTVSGMSHRHLKFNLPFEFGDYLVEDRGEYLFDYAVQEQRTEADGTIRLRLFACAVLKSTVESYRRLLRRAGRRMAAAMPSESAEGALLGSLDGAEGGENYRCLVDLGHSAVRITIFRSGENITRRTVERGLRDRTAANAAEFDSALAVEIMKAVNFFNYNHREATLQEVYLWGNGAEDAALCAAVSASLELEPQPIEKLFPAEPAPMQCWHYLDAYGCALAAMR